jgi:hypothetical protein
MAGRCGTHHLHGSRYRNHLRGVGGLNRAMLDDLANGAEKIAIGKGRRRNFTTGNIGGMALRNRLPVLVQYRDPEKIHLQEHQETGGEGTPKFCSPVMGHGALFYLKLESVVLKIDNTIPGTV